MLHLPDINIGVLGDPLSPLSLRPEDTPDRGSLLGREGIAIPTGFGSGSSLAGRVQQEASETSTETSFVDDESIRSTSPVESPREPGSQDYRLRDALPEGAKVLVTTQKIGGFGDLSAAAKFAKDLVKRGGLREDQIVCYCPFRLQAKAWKEMFLSDTNIPVVDTYSPEGVALQVALPVHAAVRRLDAVSIPTVMLQEYDCTLLERDSNGWIKSRALGLGPSSIGICFDADLVEAGKNRRDVEDRRAVLENLEAPLKNSVLGDRSPERLGEDYSLYMGYANSGEHRPRFVEAMTNLKKEKGKDCIFVLPGRAMKLEDFDIEVLRANGVKSIVIVTDKGETRHVIQESGIEVRVVSTNLSQSNFCALMKASGRKMLVTGDQSFSQAVALRKQWVYEMLSHKENLGEALRSYGAHSVISKEELSRENLEQAFREMDDDRFEALNEALLERDYFSTSIDVALSALSDNSERARYKGYPSFAHVKTVSPEDFVIGQPTIINSDQKDSLNAEDFEFIEVQTQADTIQYIATRIR